MLLLPQLIAFSHHFFSQLQVFLCICPKKVSDISPQYSLSDSLKLGVQRQSLANIFHCVAKQNSLGVLTPLLRQSSISQSNFARASGLVVLTTLILRLTLLGLINMLHVFGFKISEEEITSLVCLSAVPVKARTGIPVNKSMLDYIVSLSV